MKNNNNNNNKLPSLPSSCMMINLLTKENSSQQNNKTKQQNNNINKTTIHTCWATGSRMPAIVRVWYSGIVRPLSLPGLCKFSRKYSQRFREKKD